MTGRTSSLLLAATLLMVGCGEGEARVDQNGAPGIAAQTPADPADAPAGGESPAASEAQRDEGAGPASESLQGPEPESRSAASAAGSADGSAERSADGPADRSPESSSPERSRASAERAPAGASAAVPTGSSQRGGSEASSSQDPGTEEILRATSRAYEGLRSFRAEFDQTLRNTLLGRTLTSAGTLYQRQPDRFLMTFSDPEGDVIVSDGDYFWMYFPSVDEKQVLRTPRGAQGLDLHAQFIGDPVRRFETTYHGTEAVRGRAAHVMTLVPRESLGYERMKVWIDDEDHLVRRFELTEENGNIRHFELRDLVKNPTLPDDLFEFTPPPGAQVVSR